jgi:hypothetical protein
MWKHEVLEELKFYCSSWMPGVDSTYPYSPASIFKDIYQKAVVSPFFYLGDFNRLVDNYWTGFYSNRPFTPLKGSYKISGKMPYQSLMIGYYAKDGHHKIRQVDLLISDGGGTIILPFQQHHKVSSSLELSDVIIRMSAASQCFWFDNMFGMEDSFSEYWVARGVTDEQRHRIKSPNREENAPFVVGLFAVNIFFMLVDCKNITSEIVYPSAGMNRKRKRRGELPLMEYRVLNVDMPAKRPKGQGEQAKTGIKQRVHLCRGHFKEYTEDAPLFGRFTGRYWWQPHVRGDKKQGMIVKDYAVN